MDCYCGQQYIVTVFFALRSSGKSFQSLFESWSWNKKTANISGFQGEKKILFVSKRWKYKFRVNLEKNCLFPLCRCCSIVQFITIVWPHSNPVLLTPTILFLSPTDSAGTTKPCSSNNGGCPHLCLPKPDNQKACACTTGFCSTPL